MMFTLIKVQLDSVSFRPDSDFSVIELDLTAVKGEVHRGLPLQLDILAADAKGEAIP